MADHPRLFSFAFTSSLLLGTSLPAVSQQVDLQTSFLAVTNVTAESLAAKRILEASKPNPQHPFVTDALIQMAEQRFQRGKKFYQGKEFDKARKEFDGAVDLMLQASENPSDRAAFERRMEDMVDAIHRYDMSGLGSSVTIEPARFEKAPLEDILQMTFPVDPSLKLRVREEVAMTQSQLPLMVNDAVLSYIHYFSGPGRRTMIAGLQRAGRYRPMIMRILDEEGVPQELIHLAQAESGFLPRAVSRARATGMWQFMSWRGNQYGLGQTAFSDERLDPEQATRAAARHLRDLYNEFGDWYLAIAAYNCGPVAVERAVERTGYADFFELRNRRVLPAETTAYVPIILAMTIMTKNAEQYGLTGVIADQPIEYDTVEITSPTHLDLVADLTDAPVSELMALNPALLKGVAPQNYDLRIPKGMANTLMATLQLIPAERRISWRMHKVASGETLATIGKRYGTQANSIAQANSLATEEAVEGDRLLIPAVYRESTISAPLRNVAARRGVRSTRTASARSRTSTGVVKTAARKPAAKRTASTRASAKRPTGATRNSASRSTRPARRRPVVLTHRASTAPNSSANRPGARL